MAIFLALSIGLTGTFFVHVLREFHRDWKDGAGVSRNRGIRNTDSLMHTD
ncbi:MAG TPA: hypothetical protein VEG64_07635 [Candidatus Sulfotelmatobacter sp.]|nr:hypothetical protein [Candidatus Sulfotelmatobacter sp.]